MKKEKDKEQALENLKTLEEAKLISRRDFLSLSSLVASTTLFTNFLTMESSFAWVATRMRRGKASNSSYVDVGDIEHSLRFRSAATAFLSKSYTGGTSPADTSMYKKHYHFFVKRSALGATQIIISNYYSGTNFWNIYFSSTDQFAIYNMNAGVVAAEKTTTAVFRDVSAHYCIDVIVDTTLATAEDRVQIWINGSRITSWASSTNPAQNTYIAFLTPISGTWVSRIGHRADNTYPFDGYLSRFTVLDGVSGTSPSLFGYLNANTNSWVTKSQAAVKAVVDANGTNSFMLDFDDGTSTTTLGYDKSAKANNWALNNITLTAGATYDWMLDTPSNNYCVLNPFRTTLFLSILNSANLNFQTDTPTNGGANATFAIPTSGKWYWEVTFTNNGNKGRVALSDLNVASGTSGTAYYGYKGVDGATYYQGGAGPTLSTYASNDVIGVAVDMDNGKIYFSKNGSWQNSSDPVAGTNPVFSSVSYSQLCPFFSDEDSATTVSGSANFGQRAYAYTPPSGYKSLCTKNLPTPTIVNTKKHFDVATRTGTGAVANVTGKLFAPGLVWIKNRGATGDPEIYDSVRGANKYLLTDSTIAEGTLAQGLTAFNSDGYSFGTSSGSNTNISGNTYVDWLWKAGGSTVANSQGSITSQVSANPKAGFSIVSYTGTGANATVGHGLSVAPKMIILKKRADAAASWNVYHADIGNQYYLNLELTVAKQGPDATRWNSTSPTSTVFSLGSVNATNGTGAIIAYCFAEIAGFSKISSYTGNGSVDGTFVHCGFRPKWLMVKDSSSGGGQWFVVDAGRDSNNVIAGQLNVNSSSAESIGSYIDFVSTGFKFRGSGTNYNASGVIYIFIAIAEAPFKYANAR